MKQGEHLTVEGLQKIVSIKASMNKGLSAVLTEAFPNVYPVSRPLVEVPKNLDPHWLAGFSEGESCFHVSISKSTTCKIGFSVQMRFIIGQHSRDTLLFEIIKKNWQCGKTSVDSKNLVVRFNVLKYTELNDIIIPFFKKYPLQGSKRLDLADFVKVADLMKCKAHLTIEGLKQIRKIISEMNTGRK